MKLWGGRFTKETNQLVHNFNASISFDQKFFKQDIRRQHRPCYYACQTGHHYQQTMKRMLIVNELKNIKQQIIEAASLRLTRRCEDIHSFVEATLIERIRRCRQKAAHRPQP